MTGDPQHLVCPCNSPSTVPMPCPYHQTMMPPWTSPTFASTQFYPFPQSLSDEDVERIAKRVVELLKASGSDLDGRQARARRLVKAARK